LNYDCKGAFIIVARDQSLTARVESPKQSKPLTEVRGSKTKAARNGAAVAFGLARLTKKRDLRLLLPSR